MKSTFSKIAAPVARFAREAGRAVLLSVVVHNVAGWIIRTLSRPTARPAMS